VSYASGHLIFARDETLMARPFDLDHVNCEAMPFHWPSV
jgi:hypothetical protein